MAVILAKLRVRLRELVTGTSEAARRAAPRIEAKLRADATTRRGNIPQYPPLGPLVPITAKAVGESVVVRAAAWVLKKAFDKGQVARWGDIAREESRARLKERGR